MCIPGNQAQNPYLGVKAFNPSLKNQAIEKKKSSPSQRNTSLPRDQKSTCKHHQRKKRRSLIFAVTVCFPIAFLRHHRPQGKGMKYLCGDIGKTYSRTKTHDHHPHSSNHTVSHQFQQFPFLQIMYFPNEWKTVLFTMQVA